jgi:hypothetical protein
MTKLNQIIALANGKKANCTKAITEIYHVVQKPDLFNGFERKYSALDEEGENLPPEKKIVQQTVQDNLAAAQAEFVELFDIIATQEWANCEANADIIVDGNTLAKQVPVTYMLFLEKQLDNIRNLVAKVPVLSSDTKWNKDDNTGMYVTDVTFTNRTKKVPKAFVRSPATDKHPAQVDVFNEDIIVGNWHKIDMSGAIPASHRDAMLKRVEKLREALKVAREEANGMVVKEQSVGKDLTNYVFGVQ